MSLFDSFFKKSKLDKAIKQVAKARKREGAEAEHLFKSAYADFADVIANDLLFTETLYNWGFALLHQAKTKSGDDAIRLYEEAIAKFSFCLTVNASSLGSAIDGGVAYMELARLKGALPADALYDMAKQRFQQANSIQKGSASYNLACVFALRNEADACLSALEDSRNHGSLPAKDDMLNDADLDNVKSHRWFSDFIGSLEMPVESEPEVVEENVPELDAEAPAKSEPAAESVAALEEEVKAAPETGEVNQSEVADKA